MENHPAPDVHRTRSDSPAQGGNYLGGCLEEPAAPRLPVWGWKAGTASSVYRPPSCRWFRLTRSVITTRPVSAKADPESLMLPQGRGKMEERRRRRAASPAHQKDPSSRDAPKASETSYSSKSWKTYRQREKGTGRLEVSCQPQPGLGGLACSYLNLLLRMSLRDHLRGWALVSPALLKTGRGLER